METQLLELMSAAATGNTGLFRFARSADVFGALPMLIVAIVAVGALMASAFLRTRRLDTIGYLSVAGLAFAALASWLFWTYDLSPLGKPLFSGMLVIDHFALFFNFIVLLGAAASILSSFRYIEANNARYAEFFPLMLFAASGMMLLVGASDLLTLFLGVELMSIPIYVLAAMLRHRARSVEGGFKYFVLGAFATGFLLYGSAFLYGATGQTSYAGIARALSAKGGIGEDTFALIGITLLLIGLAFKVALAPFHMWTPDAYDGAPAFITGFMATAVKAAGFAAFVRVAATLMFGSSGGDFAVASGEALALIAIATMFIGNLSALPQTRLKRMLAYSSIAHAGYALVGVVAASRGGDVARDAMAAVLYYMAGYAVMSLGAFAVITKLERDDGKKGINLADYAGLAHRKPGLALAMAIFIFALAGIPPFAGFFGKFFLFKAAVDAGFTYLAVLGVINSFVSVYYYLSVIVAMYMKDSAEDFETPPNPALNFAVGVSIALVIYLGVFAATPWQAALKGVASILRV